MLQSMGSQRVRHNCETELTNPMRASLVAQMVKNPSAIWETWVQSLNWEDPLEKGRATYYSILAWIIPRTV